MAWIQRLGSRRARFRYVDSRGRLVRDRSRLGRIQDLRIPPAWRDVHVADSPRSMIQAWGFDAKGRKQYRYNQRAVDRRELRKHHRVRQLAHRLADVRRTLASDSKPRSGLHALDRDVVAATALRLIVETFSRIGGERYARENGTFGITTLKKSHVRFRDGLAVLSYRGKSRKRQRQFIADPVLLRLLKRQMRTPGTRLFMHRSGDAWRALTARDVNAYLWEHFGPFCAKDFRTWGGTLRLATVLSDLGPAGDAKTAQRNVSQAIRFVAAELGNTPAVCRSSYVHPMVIAKYIDDQETIRPAGPVHTRGPAREERALIRFLDRHFPERRRARARVSLKRDRRRTPSPSTWPRRNRSRSSRSTPGPQGSRA